MPTTEAVNQLAAALRSIIGHDDNRPLRVIAGTDTVDEDDIPPEGIVTVTQSAIVFWRRIDHDRGPYSISRMPIDGLAAFMNAVMWPRLVRAWDEHRLMADKDWSAQERAAIDAWEFGKARLRRLIHRDHLVRMQSHPDIRALYLAVHGHDAATLRGYTGELAGMLEEIGSAHIQTLAQAIEEGNRELTLSQTSFLVFRAATIAVMANEDYDTASEEQDDCLKDVSSQRAAVVEVAQRRYAAQFLAMCLSPDMLDLHDRHFAGFAAGDRATYAALISALVGARLETVGQTAFLR